MADAARLLALAEAVADGDRLDWPAAESDAANDDERDLVRELRLLAGIAEAHRSADAEAAPDSRNAASLKSWGPLEVRHVLSAGAFGTVYLAWDPRLAREVALKILHVDSLVAHWTPSAIHEGRLLARVKHPHVITVFGADQFDGRVGMWTELIRGRTLEGILHQDGPLGAREAALIGVDLCSALAAVHAVGLVHRDVKAQNVMREDGGRIVLMDFGAGHEGRIDGSAALAGTPLYMAPELFAGKPATPAADLYSLGVLLFRLVTGAYPVEGKTFAEIRDAHAQHSRKRLRDLRPDLPLFFVRAVEHALDPSPSTRIASAGALESALAAGLAAPAGGTIAGLFKSPGVIVACLLLLVVAAAAALIVSSTPATGRSAAPPAPAEAARVIVVRPLKNLTGDASQEYFAAGLTDVLLAHLGGIRALRVLPVASGDDHEAEASDAIRRRHPNVTEVLEGSVQRGGGRVRISVRLVNAATGAIVWGRSYEGSDAEIFTLQGTIAAELARDLNIEVTDVESRRLSRVYTVSAQAQDAYLRGRHLLDSLTRPNLIQARLELERAVRLEPRYAPAYASLALTYLALGNVGELLPSEVRALAPKAAVTAFTADPALADAALALADVRFRLDWDWPGAEDAYRRAVDLNPSYMEARTQFARFLAAAERPGEALAEAQEAMRIDPLSSETHNVVGMMLYYNARYDDAIAHFRERLDPRSARGHVGLGRAYAAARRFSEADAELTAAYELSGEDPSILAEIGRTRAEAGDQEGARRILIALEDRRRARKEYIAPQDLAYIHVALGETDAGIALLNEAVDERASRLLWLAVDPRINPIKSDPEFIKVLARIGRGR